MKKQVLSILLALSMLAGTVVGTSGEMVVQAEENEAVNAVGEEEDEDYDDEDADDDEVLTYGTSGNYEYQVRKNGTVEITDYTEEEGVTEITIPSEIDGKKVVRINSSTFENCDNLTSINIPSSVTSIGERAFQGCDNLTSINIPNLAGSIGYGTFSECKSLTNITILGSITSIDERAFYECESLTSINIPNSITSIGEDAFSGCKSLTKITIPDSVTTIGNHAFYGCENLSDIQFPRNAIYIGRDAFRNTTWYDNHIEESTQFKILDGILLHVTNYGRQIEFPDSITRISSDAFPLKITTGCSVQPYYAYSIKIPNSVTVIEDRAFYACSNLKYIEIPNTITYIGNLKGYYGNHLTDIYYTGSKEEWNNIKMSSENDFSNITIHYNSTMPTYCYKELEDGNIEISFYNEETDNTGNIIPELVIPSEIDNKKVTHIGQEAFRFCQIVTVTIPHSVTNIGYFSFDHCRNLKNITIPDSVTSIEMYAFNNCEGLTRITIPNSVTSIEDYAFCQCTSLTNVTFLNPATKYDDDAFYRTPWLDNGKINSSSNTDNTDKKNENTNTDQKSDSTTDNTNSSNSNNSNNNPSATPKATNVTLSAINLSSTSVTYTGKAQKPAVTITDANGQIVDASNYAISYANNKNVGQAAVTVTGIGNYTGTLSATFTILPKGTKLSKVTAKKRRVYVKWKKQTAQTTGYEISYAPNAKFKGAKTITIKKNKTASATIKKLKSKKKYYVRVRTYKTVKINGKSTKLYSTWSGRKAVKVK